MGFLSSVWKGVKNVFAGVMKVFTPILAPLAKAMDTGWGKALMIALSIFTMGTAFVAAQAMYATTMAASGSMLQAFVQGGIEFVKVFLGAEASELGAGAAAAGTAAGSTGAAAAEMGTAAGALEGAAGVTAGNVGAAGDLVAGAGSGALQGAGAGTGAAAGAGKAASTMKPLSGPAPSAGPTTELAAKGGELATRVPPGAEGNWLSKAAKSAWDFASKDDFKNTKDLISGYSEIEEREDVQKHEDRYARRWRDPGSKGMQAFDSALEDSEQPRFSPGGPGRTLDRNRRGFNPTIPFRGKGQPQGAGG